VTVPIHRIDEKEKSVTVTKNTSIAYTSGFYIELPLKKKSPFILRMDLEGIWGHRREFFNGLDSNLKGGLYMNYLLKWKFSPFTSPYIISGLRGGLYANLYKKSINNEELGNSSEIKIFDGGIVVGAGLELDLKDMSAFLEWRYYHGLGRLSTNQLDEYYNSFYSLSLGIQLKYIAGGGSE
jgi:hypothetical protein